jgi:fermentation-respiration switch protein FrsA (DUF1100 family)
MLILQGTRDYQVTLEDLQRYRLALAGKPKVEIHELAGLNHMFMGGEGPANPAEYDTPGHVRADVIDLIAQFVEDLPQR